MLRLYGMSLASVSPYSHSPQWVCGARMIVGCIGISFGSGRAKGRSPRHRKLAKVTSVMRVDT